MGNGPNLRQAVINWSILLVIGFAVVWFAWLKPRSQEREIEDAIEMRLQELRNEPVPQSSAVGSTEPALNHEEQMVQDSVLCLSRDGQLLTQHERAEELLVTGDTAAAIRIWRGVDWRRNIWLYSKVGDRLTSKPIQSYFGRKDDWY